MNPFSAWTASGSLSAGRDWSEQTLLSLMWGEHASPLQTRWVPLLHDLCRLGAHQVLTTNNVGALGFVAELHWAHGDADGARLTCDGVDVDIDFHRIGAAFATGAPRSSVLPRAVRIFDRHGDVLVTFAANALGPSSDFDAFVRRNARPASPPLPRSRPHSPIPAVASEERLAAALSDWQSMVDARALEDLLLHHRLSRAQLYRAADTAQASRLEARELVQILRWMVDRKAPMSMQVGRSGVVTAVRTIPDELIVASDGIELAGGSAVLRLAAHRLSETWLVHQAGADGSRQRSLHILDDAGELAICLGGAEQDMAAGVSGWTQQPFRPGSRA